jgi:hypothetical protein
MRLINCFLFFFLAMLIVFSSCTKTTTVHESETDTVVIRQHVTINDTFYNLTNGIAAWLPFTDGSLHDKTSWNNDIVNCTATPTTDRFGNPNNAYLFDGTNYMESRWSETLTWRYLTLMVVVKFKDFNKGDGFDNTIVLSNRYDTAANAYGILVHPQSYNPAAPLDTTKEMFVARFGDIRVADSSTLVHTGVWYIVALTYDGSFLKLYINGELRNSKAAITSLMYTGFGLYMGECLSPYKPSPFAGVIDEIRVYDKALTADYIRQFNKLTQ